MIEYGISGDLKYISHHDTLRLFRRALARSCVPVRFSEGFNPHPRMTIPLPRPVGISSDVEAIVIETESSVNESDWLERLGAQVPRGLQLRGVRRLADGEKPQPDTVTYRFRPDGPLPDDLDERLTAVASSGSLVTERMDDRTKRMRKVDLKPYLLDLRRDGAAIRFTLRVTDAGTARPAEIVGFLGFDPAHVNHRIHRQEVRWR